MGAVTRGPAVGWGLVVVAAAAVVAITAIVATTGVLPGETALRAMVRGTASPEMRSLARTIRPLGTWLGLVPGLLLILMLSRYARQRWWLWAAALVAATLAGEALQELVGRLRPQGSALGFPSGHATAVAAFAVATIYLVGRSRLARGLRVAIGLAAVLGTLAIGLSRMVLDAHWTLDVVAGFALGAAGAAAAAWWDVSHPPPPLAAPGRSTDLTIEAGRRPPALVPDAAGSSVRSQRVGGNSASLRGLGHPKLPASPFRVTSAATFTTLLSSPATWPAGLQAKVRSKGAPLIVPKTRYV